MRLDHLLSKETSREVFYCEAKGPTPVAMRIGGTPVPIPNTMVKTYAADGTPLVTARESRRLPESLLGT